MNKLPHKSLNMWFSHRNGSIIKEIEVSDCIPHNGCIMKSRFLSAAPHKWNVETLLPHIQFYHDLTWKQFSWLQFIKCKCQVLWLFGKIFIYKWVNHLFMHSMKKFKPNKKNRSIHKYTKRAVECDFNANRWYVSLNRNF